MLFDFILLEKDRGNLYSILYQNIKDAIISEVIKKGEKLPSIRDCARQFGVSRTTVENAYNKLCIQGIIESVPQKGYYVLGINTNKNKNIKNDTHYTKTKEIEYDFSSRKIDVCAADTEIWKKLIRQVLNESWKLNSYGDFRGENSLRETLSEYSYKMRGVKAKKENIIIGAGIGPLLNILCGILNKNIKIGIENGGFKTAENIFSSYGIETVILNSDKDGAKIEDINEKGIDVLFLMPSAMSKISVSSLGKRRNEYVKWADENKIIIEDDYNGELRYTARSIPAFQNKLPEKCIYIGSFSKLLLPSVRIAYMVLPDDLADEFNCQKYTFNQTCGKIEQLALEKYIKSGAMEKHLRKLRKIYYNKSKILINSLQKYKNFFKSITLFETSLIVELDVGIDKESAEICKLAEKYDVRVMESKKKGNVRLSFGGIREDKIENGIEALYQCLHKKIVK